MPLLTMLATVMSFSTSQAMGGGSPTLQNMEFINLRIEHSSMKCTIGYFAASARSTSLYTASG